MQTNAALFLVVAAAILIMVIILIPVILLVGGSGESSSAQTEVILSAQTESYRPLVIAACAKYDISPYVDPVSYTHLSSRPHRLENDLAVYYAVRVYTSGDGVGTITITNQLMKSMGVTAKDLDDAALNNISKEAYICLLYTSEQSKNVRK